MKKANGWSRADGLITVSLFLGTFISRIPFRTTLLGAWDSVLYTRAIEHFDITIDQPQPPGHLFYVGLIRLANVLTGEPNSAMVWVSILAAAAAVTALYWAGRMIFDRQAALAAALLLATSLSFWSLSEVALPYTLLGFLSVTVSGLIYLAWVKGRFWVYIAALSLALASGFREDLLPFLLPLLAFAIWNKGRWRVLVAALLLAGGIAAWYVPSALLSGGLGPYREASSTQSDYLFTYFSVFGLGARALGINVYTLLRFSLYAFSSAALLVPVLLWALVSTRTRSSLRDRRLLFLIIWMAPSLLFYLFIHLGEFGYIFTFLPAGLLLCTRGLQIMAAGAGGGAQAEKRPRRLFRRVTLTLVALNLVLFLLLSQPLSANRLAARDDILRSRIETIKANFSPGSTLVLSVYDYQQVSYYLAEFPSRNFDPSVEKNPVFALPSGVDRVVLFDEYLSPAGSGDTLTLPLDLDQTLTVIKASGKNRIRVDWDSRKVFLENG